MAAQLAPLQLLHSWKEIAAYAGRGVRTVQRWEHDLGLPVHRPKGKDRSAVLAFSSEIDDWFHRTPVRNPLVFSSETRARLETAARLRQELVNQVRQQQEAVRRVISTLRDTVQSMASMNRRSGLTP